MDRLNSYSAYVSVHLSVRLFESKQTMSIKPDVLTHACVHLVQPRNCKTEQVAESYSAVLFSRDGSKLHSCESQTLNSSIWRRTVSKECDNVCPSGTNNTGLSPEK